MNKRQLAGEVGIGKHRTEKEKYQNSSISRGPVTDLSVE
jgi:hypothetical protein